MFRKFLLCFILLSLPLFSISHPHAFIYMQAKPLINKNTLLGFSMEWTLDELSSAAILYDIRQIANDAKALRKLVDETMGNIVNEHYFSHLFDKAGNRVKYSAQPKNYGIKSGGRMVTYYFDFMLAHPRLLENETLTLSTYDPTYYVSMCYGFNFQDCSNGEKMVDFSTLPANCKGEVINPQVDEKIIEYASSLDQSQRNEDDSLGAIFAQQVKFICK